MQKRLGDSIDLRLIELQFTRRDTDLFAIPDARARVDALQNYFFPRLQIVLDECVRQIKSAYGLDALATMSFRYSPNPRTGKATRGTGEYSASMGLGGQKVSGRLLRLIKPNGLPASMHPGALRLDVLRNGSISVRFDFWLKTSKSFVNLWLRQLEAEKDFLTALFSLSGITWGGADIGFVPWEYLDQELEADFDSDDLVFYSKEDHFDCGLHTGIAAQIQAFVQLYPLLHTCVEQAEGRDRAILDPLLENQVEWLPRFREEVEAARGATTEPAQGVMTDGLDPYIFVRAGRWAAVIARDGYRCLSCGRSPRADGVTLEVDHKIPRSRGGTDDTDNLQTLCRKCNIGKSNLWADDLHAG